MQKLFDEKAVEMKEHDLAMEAFMNVCKITLKQQTMNHNSLGKKRESENDCKETKDDNLLGDKVKVTVDNKRAKTDQNEKKHLA